MVYGTKNKNKKNKGVAMNELAFDLLKDIKLLS